MYENGEEQKFMSFDGSLVDFDSWYNRLRLLNSSYEDLIPAGITALDWTL